MKENFGKEYKLCSKIQIDQVFASGFRISQFPLQALVLSTTFSETIPFKVLISVPKKRIKKAVDRNYVKRLLREVIRKNKLNLETFLIQQNIQLAICIVYSTSEEMNYSELETKINKLFNKLINHVSEQNFEKKD
ncbi:MAG: ribonuclease P protein component [Bacteroidota bacterium]